MNSYRTAFLNLISPESRTYSLTPAAEVVIGREPTCQIVLDSPAYSSVSRRHALIRFRPDVQTFEVSDLGSSNGTFINGQRLQGSQLLKAGDRLQLGTDGVEFSFDDPALPATVVNPAGYPAAQPAPPFNQPDYGSAPSYPPPAYSPPSYSPPSASSQPVTGSGNNGVKVGLIVGSLFAVIVVGGLAWQYLSSRSSQITTPPAVSNSPTSAPSPSATEPATAASGQPYVDPNGLFQVNLPSGYATEPREDGINISSEDGSFQGAITAARIPNPLSADQLVQSFVNQQNNNPNLQEFTLQNSEPIDGGVRVDWIGRLTSGIALDAVTHFFQQGNVVVEVDLFAVDRAFNEQDVSEANTILQSVRVGQ